MSKKILFIDRDGTLIDEPKENFQVDSMKKLKFEPYVIPALLNLSQHNYSLILITNQDGLGKKNFSWSDFYLPHNFMLDTFQSQGIHFKQVLICPHNLEDNCSCRKPKLKLVEPWLKKRKLDKLNSYVIGDRQTDLQLAKNMGINGILYNRKKNNWNHIEDTIINNKSSYITRNTAETKISVFIKPNSNKSCKIKTSINFFDHMLEQMFLHGKMYSNILCSGDVNVDDHHLIEDTGIVIGQSLSKLLEKNKKIERYGFTLPMDEAISKCTIDISGRPFLKFNAHFKYQKVGDLSTEMIKHFFYSLSYSMGITLHIQSNGENDHHIAESIFKSFGKTINQAMKTNLTYSIPSSKGIL